MYLEIPICFVNVSALSARKSLSVSDNSNHVSGQWPQTLFIAANPSNFRCSQGSSVPTPTLIWTHTLTVYINASKKSNFALYPFFVPLASQCWTLAFPGYLYLWLGTTIWETPRWDTQSPSSQMQMHKNLYRGWRKSYVIHQSH